VLVVADVEVISKAPYRFTRAGVGDAISNITAVKDRLLAHKLRGEYYSEYAAELSRLSAELVLRYAPIIKEGLLEGIRVLIKALISSGVAMAIAGSSRPASGAEHLFAHALERIRPGVALHGEMVGVGTIMMAYLHGMDRRSIREALMHVDAPVDYEGLGVEPIDIIKALTTAHTIRKKFTILGEQGITREAAVRLAERTLVIPRGSVDVRP
jgi:glycerol-1-phosphate dehydrogenase [NAD(P)+]